MDGKLGSLSTEVRANKESTDKKFEAIDQRFDKIDQRMDGMDQRFDKIDQRMDGMDRCFDTIERKHDESQKMIAEAYEDLGSRQYDTEDEVAKLRAWDERYEKLMKEIDEQKVRHEETMQAVDNLIKRHDQMMLENAASAAQNQRLETRIDDCEERITKLEQRTA